MSNKPTASEPTNQLIALATKIANGEESPESYFPILSQRLQQSAQNREILEGRARARGEDFLIVFGELLDQVLDLMEAYEAGLAKHAEFFDSGEPEALLAGNDLLAEAIGPLREALDVYGAAYLAFGPSPYPIMNSVVNILNGILDNSATPEALNEVTKSSISYYQTAIKQIDSSEHGKSDGYQSKRKAFEKLIAALKELKPAEDQADLDKMIRPLQMALDAKTASDEKIFLENTSLKPTNMASANILINAARGCLDEFYEVEDLRGCLHWYRNFTEEFEEQFDVAVEGETTSTVILEELPRTREILDIHAEVLDRFEDALEEFDRATIESILKDLIEQVDKLEASSQVLLEAGEREGKLVCIKCGHANLPTHRTCDSCNFKLPQLVDPTMFTQSTLELAEGQARQDDSDDDYHMGVNTFRLFESAYHFYEGLIDSDAFQMEIDSSRDTVGRSDDGLSELAARELNEAELESLTPDELQTFRDSQEMFYDTKGLLEEGMDEWLEGLDNFEQYIESRHRPTLESGIKLIFVASQKIHKVHKLGEMADRTLQQMEEEERESGAVEEDSNKDSAESGVVPEVDHVMTYEETYDDGSIQFP